MFINYHSAYMPDVIQIFQNKRTRSTRRQNNYKKYYCQRFFFIHKTVTIFKEHHSKQSDNKSIVSFFHDSTISYGKEPPFDQENNPVYDIVRETIIELNLGDPQNPLRNIIAEGNTVLIKPNLISDYGTSFTQPSVVRPLIEMAITAGAAKIYIGDGGPGYTDTNKILDNTEYDEMVFILQSRHPGVEIKLVNLNDRTHWHWINLAEKSSFVGSGYSDYDMGASFGQTLYDQSYYRTSDPQGINPNGQVMGWYAFNDFVLDSDVIINVPKMKNHWAMIVTLCLKNQVGSTLCSTYDDGTANWGRIPHCKSGSQDDEYYFKNDVF